MLNDTEIKRKEINLRNIYKKVYLGANFSLTKDLLLR